MIPVILLVTATVSWCFSQKHSYIRNCGPSLKLSTKFNVFHQLKDISERAVIRGFQFEQLAETTRKSGFAYACDDLLASFHRHFSHTFCTRAILYYLCCLVTSRLAKRKGGLGKSKSITLPWDTGNSCDVTC